ncbi:MAG: hemerythrin domain-containing protein [Candidatus Hodarchaeales archaeon]|jgi:hemerythrin-like domain-containing protein
MTQRVDFYSYSHKGLRFALNNLAFEFGKLDFNNSSKLQELSDELNNLSKFLHFHALGEDKFVFPMIKEKAESLFNLLTNQHNEFEPLEKDYLETLQEIFSLPEGDEKKALGKEFCNKYNFFISLYLKHLQVEERDLLPLLWENFTDADLIVAAGKFASAMPPEVVGYAMGVMLPASNFEERIGLMTNVKKNAPPPVYQNIEKLAENKLGNEWVPLKEIMDTI